ncbi:hypothetical protein GGI42DRAFT_337544 [Trichoderma sp. SZMC 28013]
MRQICFFFSCYFSPFSFADPSLLLSTLHLPANPFFPPQTQIPLSNTHSLSPYQHFGNSKTFGTCIHVMQSREKESGYCDAPYVQNYNNMITTWRVDLRATFIPFLHARRYIAYGKDKM